MLVQMPLSHTSPASHSSTSAGDGVSEGQDAGWVSSLCYPFPTPAHGLEHKS